MTRRPAMPLRAAALAVLVLLLTVLVVPAQAAGPRVTLAAVKTSVTVGTTLSLKGQVAPHVAGTTVIVQRKVGRSWVSVGHASSGPAGRYALRLRAPAKAATWLLRASTSTKVVSHALTVHVLRAKLRVRASAPPIVLASAAVVVAGSVSPKATGAVVLQESRLGKWVPLAKAALTRTSTYVISSVQPAGQHVYRVVKATTASTGFAASPSFPVSVVPVLTTTTATLPKATVGLPYTSQLTAVGGTPPYRWSLQHGGLPAGFTLSESGALGGTPTAAGSATITAVVSDSGGQTSSRPLILTAVLSPAARQTVVAWGYNSDGELGNGTTSRSTIPVPVPGLSGVTAVAGGGGTGYALRFDGTVWSWGYNHFGEVGDNTTDDRKLPVQVTGLSGVTAIAGGGYAGYALKADGTVWSWGHNLYGQLGNNSLVNSSVPVQVQGLTGVTSIGAGLFTGYAVTSDGTAWAWGQGGDGELGDGLMTRSSVPVRVAGLSHVVAMAGGDEDGYALTSLGTVWAWGVNDLGQIGDGTTTDRATPVQVSGIAGVVKLATGSTTGYAATSTGAAYSWGDNGDGQVGDGTTTDRHSPVLLGLSGVTGLAAATNDAGYALRFDGTVSAWGYNGHGALGDSTTNNHYLPGPVDGLTGVLAIGGGTVTDFGLAIVSG